MTKKINIFELSNTQLRKLRKKDLAEAVFTLKSIINDYQSGTDTDKIGITLKNTLDELEKERNRADKLYENNTKLTKYKGLYDECRLHSKKVQYDLERKLRNVNAILEIKNNMGFWDTIGYAFTKLF